MGILEADTIKQRRKKKNIQKNKKKKCNKQAQKEYKPKDDWSKRVVHGEMCKRLRFDLTNKWYIRKPESILENQNHKIV